MDRDANYVAVGAFVLLVTAMALSFVLWYTNQQDKHVYLRYEIYFPGSVSGLTPGSPVRYLGVDVGKVSRIMIDPKQRNRVLVIADIEANTPIDARTQASLSLQGITGLLYIDLEQDQRAPASGMLAEGLHYPVIRSARSDFDVLLSSLPNLTTHLVELAERVNQVFSDDNVRSFSAAIENARIATERLPGLIGDARQAMLEVRGAAADLRTMEARVSPDLQSTLANARVASENLAKTSQRLDSFIADNQAGVSRFTHQSLPELEQLLRESRQAARDFRDLSRSLKENPSQLIYEPAYRGVEVAK